MSSAHQAVTTYWAAVEARDWETLAGLVAGDVFYEVPQTRERVRGREAYVRFCAEGFPGDWHITVEFAEGEEMRTEVSAKFRPDGVSAELAAAGFAMRHWWTDTGGQFGLSLSAPA